jgi:peptidoglycan/LPS O-acetylase OafA/YrhL
LRGEAVTAAPGYQDSRPHYAILDGLRGVAALVVVAFHLLETHAPNRFEQLINHGYLAVDFFFLLSGFVIGYAYDARWRSMTLGEFCKRRLFRLHPMIVVAMALGALAFAFQDSPVFPKIHEAHAWQVVLTMLVGMTLLPLPPSLDIRGWGEMHPLVGPAWSLFFEYVANILYALFIRRFSKLALSLLVLLAGGVLVHTLVLGPNGDVIGGWSLAAPQLRLGFTRLMYPFFAGLLLSRVVRPGRVRHAFLLCSVLLLAALALPRFGGAQALWMNGLYESAVIVLVFPLVVWLGAGGSLHGAASTRACAFLGAISYPLYILHYPIVYTYTAWVADTKPQLQDALPVAALAFAGSVVLAWVCLKWYDEPVRRWLARRYLERNTDERAASTVQA